ncbi:hypothetical protein Plhal703r1_c01g0006551 [Plasmopara halstedii]
MVPETETNDYVPIEFLLGARVQRYTKKFTRNFQDGSVKSTHLFEPSIHPRRREEQARQLLQRILNEKNTDMGTSSLVPRLQSEMNYKDVDLSPIRINRSQKHEIQYEKKRSHISLLDVTGIATRPVKNVGLNQMKARNELKDERMKQLRQVLQYQQHHTRHALNEYEKMNKQVHLSRKHSHILSKKILLLESIEKGDRSNNVMNESNVPSRQLLDSNYAQQSPVLVSRTLKARPLSPRRDLNETLLSISQNKNESHVDLQKKHKQLHELLAQRQREIFIGSATGLFLGGGFMSKSSKPTSLKRCASSVSDDYGKIQGAQMALLPLRQTNRPTLRHSEGNSQAVPS